MIQYYWARFKNPAGNRYYLVYDKDGYLVDSFLANTTTNIAENTKAMNNRYNNPIRLSEIPPVKSLPIADAYYAEMREASELWSKKWDNIPASLSKDISEKVQLASENLVSPDNMTPKRFYLCKGEHASNLNERVVEGVLWGDGRVSCTWNKNIKADWSKVGGPPIYLYNNFQEFFYMHPPESWKFVWIDDDFKSRVAANKLVNLAKDAGAVAKLAAGLLDDMKDGQ